MRLYVLINLYRFINYFLSCYYFFSNVTACSGEITYWAAFCAVADENNGLMDLHIACIVPSRKNKLTLVQINMHVREHKRARHVRGGWSFQNFRKRKCPAGKKVNLWPRAPSFYWGSCSSSGSVGMRGGLWGAIFNWTLGGRLAVFCVKHPIFSPQLCA